MITFFDESSIVSNTQFTFFFHFSVSFYEKVLIMNIILVQNDLNTYLIDYNNTYAFIIEALLLHSI